MPVSFSLEDALLLPLIVGYAVWWAIHLREGSRIRRWYLALDLFVYTVLAIWIWIASLAWLADAGVSDGFALIWLFVLPIGVYYVIRQGYRYGVRKVTVGRSSTGFLTYRAEFEIPVFWLVLYLIRLLLEDTFLGGFSVFLPIPFPSTWPPNGVSFSVFVTVVTLVAVLYFVSFGVMIGVTLAIWGHHHKARKGAVSSTVHSTAAFCISCGTRFSEGDRFCIGCGRHRSE